MNPLGARSFWAFDWTMMAERSAAAIIATCRQFGITALWQEIAYGVVFQGQIDGLSPKTLPQVATLRDQLAAGGIGLVPVVVPRGLINQGEAELHAAIGKVCGSLVVDIEVDASGSYWPTSAIDLVGVYAAALRAAAGPDVVIGWEPDGRIASKGREWEWNRIAVRPFNAGAVDVWSPQLYAGAISPWLYGGGMETVRADTYRFDMFAAFGQPMAPTLFIADSMMEPAALWQAVGSRSIGACGFRMGAADAPRLQAFRALPMDEPSPEPMPEPPTPTVTIEQVQLGLIRKALDGQWHDLAHDAGVLAGAKG